MRLLYCGVQKTLKRVIYDDREEIRRVNLGTLKAFFEKGCGFFPCFRRGVGSKGVGTHFIAERVGCMTVELNLDLLAVFGSCLSKSVSFQRRRPGVLLSLMIENWTSHI